MSRPNTRSKNKRHRPEPSPDPSAEILRRIHLAGEVSPADVQQLYLAAKPVCDGSCRVNSKDNPNCFCALVPPPNGARKTGLWQKMSEIVAALGPNPCRDLRSSSDTPAGLTNLGATCYANSILQCLYMNASFRAGVFAVEPRLLEQHPVLDQLTRLFAQLHSSRMAFIDSAPFIKTLELDNGVQQDSHEFLTLFLSLLERSLRHSAVPKARNIIQDLFRGRVSHVTRCSACGRDSEASSKVEDFYELELNIKGLNNLYESLEDYLSIEELHGENQYFCESCGLRVNATRCIKLRELPSVLNFQLKRYVFLPKTTTKKKITSAFSFPRQLNMGPSMNNPNEPVLLYDLAAILIHKGTAVNSGHYVAHIKDDNTGQWWEFDDEHVSKLGEHPFGGNPSKSSAKSCPVPTNSFEEVHSVSNGSHPTIEKPTLADNEDSKSKEEFSSSDAYMLMYNQKNVKENSDKTLEATATDDKDIESSLPAYFYEEIDKLNASYANECDEFQLKKDRQVTFIMERRQEVKSIISEAPVHLPDDPCYWISAEWFRQWADSITPPCIDNSSILCLHGKFPASKVHSVKRVSAIAWNKLFSKYGGGPALTNEDFCIECIKDNAKNAISADNYRDRRASLKQFAEEALSGSCLDEDSYYVSRIWLVNWLRRKNVDAPCDADAGPTASLRCPHGDLLPENAAGAKRVQIPESLWFFIWENAKAAKPDDSFGCSAFPSSLKPCSVCEKELSELSCLEDSLRETKIKQRQNHEKLFLGKSFVLNPGCKYFLVPSSWLTEWRSYVTTTGKNISSSAEPGNLEVSLRSLICEKHSRLLERPLDLVCKRGLITQKSSSENGLTVISENDWHLFCGEWNVPASSGISAEIIFLGDISNKMSGSSEEAPISEADLEPLSDEANEALVAKKPFIKTCPEVCGICIGERESCELMRKLSYHDEEISVVFVTGKEPPQSLLESSRTMPRPDRRTSKRSRKASSGNSATLKVSCSTSVYQLKMMIWESFGIVKENQKLRKGSVEIEDDLATLADSSIFPGDVLWFSDTGIYENRDIADELSEQKTELGKAEEGFRGTLLFSSALLQEQNDSGT